MFAGAREKSVGSFTLAHSPPKLKLRLLSVFSPHSKERYSVPRLEHIYMRFCIPPINPEICSAPCCQFSPHHRSMTDCQSSSRMCVCICNIILHKNICIIYSVALHLFILETVFHHLVWFFISFVRFLVLLRDHIQVVVGFLRPLCRLKPTRSAGSESSFGHFPVEVVVLASLVGSGHCCQLNASDIGTLWLEKLRNLKEI